MTTSRDEFEKAFGDILNVAVVPQRHQEMWLLLEKAFREEYERGQNDVIDRTHWLGLNGVDPE